MTTINTKENIIEYFKSGIKSSSNFKIGIEHEKFLFDLKSNKRIDYNIIKLMFDALMEFGWKPITEMSNIIGLNKDGKNITLEPGNQIELSGDKLNNIHEACAESHDYSFELQQVTKKLNIKRLSLETGAGDFFLTARKLFSKCGFEPCEPFSHYKKDINSIYMTMLISNK